MKRPSLSVVVPALNEEANLGPTIAALREALGDAAIDFEIIIVDDGSTDGTGALAETLVLDHPEIRVLHNPRNMGVGYSFSRGVGMAGKDAVVFIPGDSGWPYESLVRLFGKLGAADVVTSYSTNPEVRPLSRRILSKVYTKVLNALFGHRLKYYNGLTIYPSEFLWQSPVRTHGFAFMAEALVQALARGLSYVEVGLPITERVEGKSKALRLGNILSVLGSIARLYWRLRIVPRLPSSCRTVGGSVPR